MNSNLSLLDELLPALERLDQLLARAVDKAQVAFGREAAADPYRGLYIGKDDVERLLVRRPGALTFRTDEAGAEAQAPDSANHRGWANWLQDAFQLSGFDMDVILIALAPELDSRYERLYAYLQDDVTRKRPSVDLALNLLCASFEEKLQRRIHFAPDAPLLQDGLLHLIPDPQQVQPSFLSIYLKLDDQVIRLLLKQDSADARLAPFCQLLTPEINLDRLPLSQELKQQLRASLRNARETNTSLRFYFHGARGVGKRRAAEALASEAHTRLLVADFARLAVSDTASPSLLKLLFREAHLKDAVLYLDGAESLQKEEAALPYHRLLDAWSEASGVTIVAGTARPLATGLEPLGVIEVRFLMPDAAQRRAYWEHSLTEQGIELDTHEVEVLADRFSLTPAQIAHAVAIARQHALWRAEEASGLPTLAELFDAARTQSGHDLAKLTQKIDPIHDWDDIVLPADAMAQLHEICQHVALRQRVLGAWGFGRKLMLGRGINALFAGPSGTGKTTAAEIIANELGLDLYKVELSSVISKYIGETEKNLERIFTAAENANAILFFDEADALFGKRSEVRDSHDRYANIEIAYLLQKMEQYEGVAILATNLRQNMDEAFTRRLQFIVEFPFPDEAQREQIWRIHFPREAPRDDGVDFGLLARQFRLCGGNIKNIVLNAAFFGAADGGRIGMDHLIRAAQREYQKMGYVFSEAELGRHWERSESNKRGQ